MFKQNIPIVYKHRSLLLVKAIVPISEANSNNIAIVYKQASNIVPKTIVKINPADAHINNLQSQGSSGGGGGNNNEPSPVFIFPAGQGYC